MFSANLYDPENFTGAATNTINMGLSMINTIDKKYPKNKLETKDINHLSGL